MPPTFVVEDGSGLDNSNSFASVAEADQYIANYGGSTGWAAALQAVKEMQLRIATRYLCLKYSWKGVRVKEDQALVFPRVYVEDRDGYGLDSNVVPQKVKDAVCYLAGKGVDGTLLMPDLAEESPIKSITETVGPISESKTYAGSDSPEETEFQVVDNLVKDYTTSGSMLSVELFRA